MRKKMNANAQGEGGSEGSFEPSLPPFVSTPPSLVDDSSSGLAVTPLARDEADWVVGAPVITLFVSRASAPASRKAFDLFEDLGLGFAVEPSTTGDVGASFGGRQQEGLAGVQELVSMLRDFRTRLLTPSPAADAAIADLADPEIGRRARLEVRRQVDEARRRMGRMLA